MDSRYKAQDTRLKVQGTGRKIELKFTFVPCTLYPAPNTLRPEPCAQKPTASNSPPPQKPPPSHPASTTGRHKHTHPMEQADHLPNPARALVDHILVDGTNNNIKLNVYNSPLSRIRMSSFKGNCWV